MQTFNPFMPIVFSHPYHLDVSISNFRVIVWYVYFSFLFKFLKNFLFATSGEPDQMPLLRCLIWFCTVCRCPTKRMLGLYGLRVLSNNQYQQRKAAKSTLLAILIELQRFSDLTTFWLRKT